MKAEIDLTHVDMMDRTADPRGRITLGSEYSGKEVRILVEVLESD